MQRFTQERDRKFIFQKARLLGLAVAQANKRLKSERIYEGKLKLPIKTRCFEM